jgi:2-dehydropantoate 2-reductase
VRLKALVVGGGAVGSWIGGALAVGGADVTLVEPGARRMLLEGTGLTLTDRRRLTRVRVGVAASIGAAAGPYDVAVVAVRSYDTAAVAEELRSSSAASRVISFQNGIGNDEVLARALPPHSVATGTLTTGLALAGDGVVQASRRGGVGIGWPPGGPEMDDLAAALRLGGLVVRLYRAPVAMKWSKLLLNLLGSATTAVLGWPPRRVFARRGLFDLERRAWLEAVSVMRALRIPIVSLPGYPVPLLAMAMKELPPWAAFRLLGPWLAGGRGDRLPSVAADLAAGRRRTENSVLTGAVVRQADARGIAAPTSRALAGLVEDLAAGRLDAAQTHGRPDVLLDMVRQRADLQPEQEAPGMGRNQLT